ncbi:hypothetical protein CDL15_Pgr004492 [Punica granatum]|uniref:Uncharacterized protein n=1 Tax=Punica granatum TaxID=22663 RepID=A0A218WC24_PUNGR|nr:hypothetical protein CDL15_Pgr004492 [Punica granatum]
MVTVMTKASTLLSLSVGKTASRAKTKKGFSFELPFVAAHLQGQRLRSPRVHDRFSNFLLGFLKESI